MRGISITLTAAVFITVTMLDSLTVEGESDFKPIEFEPIPISTEKEAEECPINRTDDAQTFTEEEKDLLRRVATAEAGNQGEDGMWMVMSVVLNRVSMDPWPDSVKEVIEQPYQFVSIDGQCEYSEECGRALERVCSGDIAPQIVAFERKDGDVLVKYFYPAFTYKDHRFYTKK